MYAHGPGFSTFTGFTVSVIAMGVILTASWVAEVAVTVGKLTAYDVPHAANAINKHNVRPTTPPHFIIFS